MKLKKIDNPIQESIPKCTGIYIQVWAICEELSVRLCPHEQFFWNDLVFKLNIQVNMVQFVGMSLSTCKYQIWPKTLF